MRTLWKLFLLLSMAAGTLQVYECRDGWTLSGLGSNKCWKAVAVQNDLWAASGVCRKENSRLMVLSSSVHAFHARHLLDKLCRGTGSRFCATLCFQNEFDPSMSYYERIPWHAEELRNADSSVNFERTLGDNDTLAFVFVPTGKRLEVNLEMRENGITSAYCGHAIVSHISSDNKVFQSVDILCSKGIQTVRSATFLSERPDNLHFVFWTFKKVSNTTTNMYVQGGPIHLESTPAQNTVQKPPAQMRIWQYEDAAADAFFFTTMTNTSQSPTEAFCNWGHDVGKVKIPEVVFGKKTYAICEMNRTFIKNSKAASFLSRLIDGSGRKMIFIAAFPVVVAVVDVFFMLFWKT